MWSTSVYCVAIVALAFVYEQWILLLLSVALLVFTWVYRSWAKRNFGGISGDLLGAIFEGAELFLWFVLLFVL